MKKNLIAIIFSIFMLGSMQVRAQDPAIGGIISDDATINLGGVTWVHFDFFNGSSTAFSPSVTVQWLINLPPCIIYDGVYTLPAEAEAYVDISHTPWSQLDGQVVFITSKPGIAFPGGQIGAWVLDIKVKGILRNKSGNITIQATSNPAVGTNHPGNDNTFTTINVGMPLTPVQLTSFTVENKGCMANLKWTTTNEKNSESYVIEMSKNQKDFVEVGKLNANNNGNLNKYDFNYSLNSNENHYFRLKMKDFDGGFTYSKIASAQCNGNGGLQVSLSPNPTKGLLKISGLTQGQNTIRIVDQQGRQLLRTIVKGDTDNSIDLSKFPSGMYHVNIIDERGNIQNLKVIRN